MALLSSSFSSNHVKKKVFCSLWPPITFASQQPFQNLEQESKWHGIACRTTLFPYPIQMGLCEKKHFTCSGPIPSNVTHVELIHGLQCYFQIQLVFQILTTCYTVVNHAFIFITLVSMYMQLGGPWNPRSTIATISDFYTS